jgi:biotin carboxyl carrier protein
MKLVARINDRDQTVEIRREGDKVFALIGDRSYELEVSEPENNVFLFKDSGKVSQAFVTPPAKAGEPYAVRIGTDETEVSLTDPKRLRVSAAVNEAAGGRAEIKTAMPGKIVRILVAAGAEVQKGDGLIVVEAMKMQNEMRSPKEGNVAEIRVAEGDTVGAGDVLLVVD